MRSGPDTGLAVQTAEAHAAEQVALGREALERLTQIATLIPLVAVLAMAAAMGAMVWQRRPRLAKLKLEGLPRVELWGTILLESLLLLGAGCLDRGRLWPLRPATGRPCACARDQLPRRLFHHGSAGAAEPLAGDCHRACDHRDPRLYRRLGTAGARAPRLTQRWPRKASASASRPAQPKAQEAAQVRASRSSVPSALRAAADPRVQTGRARQGAGAHARSVDRGGNRRVL